MISEGGAMRQRLSPKLWSSLTRVSCWSRQTQLRKSRRSSFAPSLIISTPGSTLTPHSSITPEIYLVSTSAKIYLPSLTDTFRDKIYILVQLITWPEVKNVLFRSKRWETVIFDDRSYSYQHFGEDNHNIQNRYIFSNV